MVTPTEVGLGFPSESKAGKKVHSQAAASIAASALAFPEELSRLTPDTLPFSSMEISTWAE